MSGPWFSLALTILGLHEVVSLLTPNGWRSAGGQKAIDEASLGVRFTAALLTGAIGALCLRFGLPGTIAWVASLLPVSP